MFLDGGWGGQLVLCVVHVDCGTACVTYVNLAIHSNVFFGVTVSTVCYLSMWTMVQPVSLMSI